MISLPLIFGNRKIAVTFLLGISSAIPLALVMGTLDGWLKTVEVDLKTIGYFSLVGFPYAFKYLWSPLLDRYSLPFLGRRTGWIALFQILLLFALGLMASIDPKTQLHLLAASAVVVAFLGASQDIVIDAYRADLLTGKELGPGAAVAVTGGRIGLILSGPLAFVLSDHMTWNRVYAVMAGVLACCLVATFLSPEPEDVVTPPKTLTDAVIKPFADFFNRKSVMLLLVVILLYKLGDAVAGKMTTPFLMEMQFTRSEIGLWNKFVGNFFTILGTLIGGTVLIRWGIFRALFIFGIFQALSNLVFILVALFPGKTIALIAAIGVENLCGGMGTAAFVAFLMSLCSKQYTATQYALLSSIMALTRMLAGAPTGILVEQVGWIGFFSVSAVLAIPGLVVLLFAKKAIPTLD